jgi:hypothetical protein
LLVGACGSSERGGDAHQAEAASVATALSPDPGPVAAQPAASDPDTPSYEIAIATAAANRNHARAECEKRSGVERETCLAEVEKQWETTRAALETSRGQQQ